MAERRNFAMEIANALAKADAQTLAAIGFELLASLGKAEAIIGEASKRPMTAQDGRNRARSTYVYYARAGNEIKIGISRNPWARLAEIVSHRPNVGLLAMELGDHQLERQRHSEFAAHRISPKAEWFRWCPAIEAHVAAIVAATDDATVATHSSRGSSTTTTTATTQSSSSAREELLNTVPHRRAWEGELQMAQDGAHGAMYKATDAQVETACRDYLGNGASSTPNLTQFRAYLRRAVRGELPPPPRRTGGVGQRSHDNAVEALKDVG